MLNYHVIEYIRDTYSGGQKFVHPPFKNNVFGLTFHHEDVFCSNFQRRRALTCPIIS